MSCRERGCSVVDHTEAKMEPTVGFEPADVQKNHGGVTSCATKFMIFSVNKVHGH